MEIEGKLAMAAGPLHIPGGFSLSASPFPLSDSQDVSGSEYPAEGNSWRVCLILFPSLVGLLTLTGTLQGLHADLHQHVLGVSVPAHRMPLSPSL